MNKLLLATKNPAKIREIKLLLAKLPIEIVALSDLGPSRTIEENGKTFEENAVLKATFFSELSGLPTMADDGGLEIDALQGWPGVKSRRMLGRDSTDEEMIALTLKKLKNVPAAKRRASMRVVFALKVPGRDKIYVFEAHKEGFIAEKPLAKRISGFPFRSIFYLPEKKKVWAGMSVREQAKISQRAEAIKKMLPILKQIF